MIPAAAAQGHARVTGHPAAVQESTIVIWSRAAGGQS
jgi:hypothetical protein